MFIKSFAKSCKNYIRYSAILTLLLLLNICTNARTTFHLQQHVKNAKAHHNNQSESRLFLIAVIDSNDETIGKRCETDLFNIQFIFEDLAYSLGVQTVEQKIIMGDDFSKATVNDALDNWLPSYQPTATDMIVFYYSGHGFRYQDDASSYPRMWLKTADNKDIQTSNLQIEQDVYNRIIKIGAGFNLVLTDCCNTTAAGDNANFDNVTVPTRKKQSHKHEEKDNADDGDEADEQNRANSLFFPGQTVSIIANAADKGEFAAGKADVGGFFTNYFVEALEDGIYYNKEVPTWQSIFKDADEKASYWARSASCPAAKHTDQGRCVQTVAFTIK